eukprot:354123-Chlamydomonas_euryale.AAC.2
MSKALDERHTEGEAGGKRRMGRAGLGENGRQFFGTWLSERRERGQKLRDGRRGERDRRGETGGGMREAAKAGGARRDAGDVQCSAGDVRCGAVQTVCSAVRMWCARCAA